MEMKGLGWFRGKWRKTTISISVIKAAPDTQGGRTNSGGMELLDGTANFYYKVPARLLSFLISIHL